MSSNFYKSQTQQRFFTTEDKLNNNGACEAFKDSGKFVFLS